jgi:hypothetical protein
MADSFFVYRIETDRVLSRSIGTPCSTNAIHEALLSSIFLTIEQGLLKYCHLFYLEETYFMVV